MFDNINNQHDGERGQVGIGTLIVFIALVLVAAIAAGVLINTAGFLQNQAESTGQESTKQVTQSLDVQSKVGTVNASGTGVDTIEMTVDKSPGSEAIDLSKTTIQYVSPYGATTLVHANSLTAGDQKFTTVGGTTTLTDSTAPVTIKISNYADQTNDSPMDSLDPGDEVTMIFSTPSGGETSVVATVKSPLTEGSGEDVRL